MYRTSCPKCGFNKLAVYRVKRCVGEIEENVYPANVFLSEEGLGEEICSAKVQCYNCASSFDLEDLKLEDMAMADHSVWTEPVEANADLGRLVEKVAELVGQEQDFFKSEAIVAVQMVLISLRAYCDKEGLNYQEASDGSYLAYLSYKSGCKKVTPVRRI